MQDVTGAVIAAAGMGTRLGLGLPKCMIEIAGKTLLTRMLAALREHVPVIHLVVGYREEMVIEYCGIHHRDIVLVRNPDFRSTNTAHSFYLGARHLSGKVLYLDGDLLLAPGSLRNFLAAARARDILVGVTGSTSQNAVFVHGEEMGDTLEIRGFSRLDHSKLEWANVVVAPNDFMKDASGYVYERLMERLPLQGHILDLAEVDTSSDLDAARLFASRLDESVL